MKKDLAALHTQNKVLKEKGLGFWFQLVKI